jgi:hypothetical protein
MSHLKSLVVAAAAIVLVADVGHGQRATTLTVGARVRFANAKPVANPLEVVSFAGDSLALRTATGDTLRLGKADASSLQISQGIHQRKLKGAMMGLLIGASVGVVLGAITYEEPKCGPEEWLCGFMDPGRGGTAAIVGTAGGVVGAVVGLIAGAIPTERWRPVSAR